LTAENVDAATELMDRAIFHLAIIDVRLTDERYRSDESGLDLAQRLPSYVPCIIYTAYEDRENLRRALGPVGAKEVVDKALPDAPSRLINTVNKLFRSDVQVNFELRIEGPIPLKDIAAQIEVVHSEELPSTADDIRQICQVLFFEAISIEIISFISREPAARSTYSGSAVMQVRPQFSSEHGVPVFGVPVVVKFSNRDEIALEAKNYGKMKPFLGGQRLAVLEHEAYSRSTGGMVYSLINAENGGTIKTFGEVFANRETEDLIAAMERFFSQTFSTIYADATRRNVDLTTTYVKGLDLSASKLRLAIEEIRPQALTEVHLSFSGIPSTFRNPILWALPNDEFRALREFTRVCLCHGDLHGRNILVDADNHFWLIDFARVAEGHALRDFAELETDIKFNLLPTVDPAVLLPLERALLAPTNFLEASPTESFDNSRLDHVYQTVTALRRIAFELIHLEGDAREYYIALFFHTINAIRLRYISKEKKEHALLSAALICERLDNWPSWTEDSPSADTIEPKDDSAPSSSEKDTEHQMKMRIFGAIAGFAIGLIPFVILWLILENALLSGLILVILAIIAFAISGLITGKDAVAALGKIVDKMLDNLKT
jgi:hypothetical protein